MAVDGSQIVDQARKYLGDKYVYGDAGPDTFDCSGLVKYVMAQLGIDVPRTSQEQYDNTDRIDLNQIQAGDLVFSQMQSSGPDHVGIYDGQGDVIEAPHTGDVVKVVPLQDFNPVAFGRVKDVQPTLPSDDLLKDLLGYGMGAQSGQGGIAGGLGSLFGKLIKFPAEITDYARTAGEDSAKALGWATAFFTPSTYVRLGAGLLGTVFLVAGLYTLFLVESE